MKKMYVLPLFVVLMLISFIAIGCDQSSLDNIDLTTLAINVKDFPTGWSFSGVSEKGIEYYRSVDSVSIFFNPTLYPDTYSSVQSIYRFKTIGKAERDFAKELEFYRKFYFVPSEWAYESILADESYFSCREESERCSWIARYENIVIGFQAPATPDLMTLQDFENILKVIDLKVNQILNEK